MSKVKGSPFASRQRNGRQRSKVSRRPKIAIVREFMTQYGGAERILDVLLETGNDRLSGRAMVLTMPSSMAEIHCRLYPFRTRGIVLNVDTASTASLDINVFSVR